MASQALYHRADPQPWGFSNDSHVGSESTHPLLSQRRGMDICWRRTLPGKPSLMNLAPGGRAVLRLAAAAPYSGLPAAPQMRVPPVPRPLRLHLSSLVTFSRTSTSSTQLPPGHSVSCSSRGDRQVCLRASAGLRMCSCLAQRDLVLLSATAVFSPQPVGRAQPGRPAWRSRPLTHACGVLRSEEGGLRSG